MTAPKKYYVGFIAMDWTPELRASAVAAFERTSASEGVKFGPISYHSTMDSEGPELVAEASVIR